MTSRMIWIAVLVIPTTVTGCGNGVVTEARKAEREGRIINNEVMGSMYRSSFRRGDPPYLERDFEAGADFICDEIKQKRGKDLCSDEDINWR